MPLKLETVERALRAEPRLRVIYDEGYELSFEGDSGLQIAVNRKDTARAIRVWIQNTLDPSRIGLSSAAKVTHYPPSKKRAHLSAPKLTGPYKDRRGNDCWYIALADEADLRTLLSAYLKSPELTNST